MVEGKRLRVAVVYHHFAHYREEVLRELLHSSRVDWNFFADDQDYQRFGVPGVSQDIAHRIHRLRCTRLRGSVMWQSGLIRLCLSRRFDVVVLLGNPHWIATWIGAVVRRLLRLPVCYWTIGYTRREPPGLRRFVRGIFLRIPNRVAFYGNYAKGRAFAEAGRAPESSFVVRNSVAYSELRARRGAAPTSLRSDETPTFVFLGRLVKRRALDSAICALARLRDEGRGARLLIVGDGPERENLLALAESVQVDVRFLGGVYDKAVTAELLRDSVAVIAPGSVGLLAIEALTLGVPVITHDDPAEQGPEFEALRDEETAFLFERGSQDSLVRAMHRAIICGSDEVLRAQVWSHCTEEVDLRWTPTAQRSVLESMVLGEACPSDAGIHGVRLFRMGIEDGGKS